MDLDIELHSVESGIHRMESTAFVASMFRRFGRKWIIIFSSALLLSLIPAVTFDVRFFIVALMIVFVVIPMVLAALYYSYGLRRECFMNIVPHRVSVGREHLTVTLLTDRDSEDENEWKGYSFDIPFSSFLPYRVCGDAVEMPLKEPYKGFLWLPVSAYADVGEYAGVLADVYRVSSEDTV